jgi:hypothetical protein
VSLKCTETLCLYPFNTSESCVYSQLNVLRPCDLRQLTLTNAICQLRRVTKPSQVRHKITPDPHKYATDLDIHATASYNTLITQRSVLMSVAYSQAQKVRYRITLDISAFPDFDPHQIDWEKLFKLEPAERVDAYIEDLSTPDRW